MLIVSNTERVSEKRIGRQCHFNAFGFFLRHGEYNISGVRLETSVYSNLAKMLKCKISFSPNLKM